MGRGAWGGERRPGARAWRPAAAGETRAGLPGLVPPLGPAWLAATPARPGAGTPDGPGGPRRVVARGDGGCGLSDAARRGVSAHAPPARARDVGASAGGRGEGPSGGSGRAPLEACTARDPSG